MIFHKEFIEEQFRGFESAKDRGNNIIAVRVVVRGCVVALWKIKDTRHVDAVIRDAIDTAIANEIVPAGTV